MIEIQINRLEYMWASFAGILRHWQNVLKENPRVNAHGLDPANDYEVNTLGAVAEYAASIALNVAWRGPGIFRGDDIQGFQIRATRYTSGCLILHDADRDDARYILVIGDMLNWKVIGWIEAREGKRREYWREGRKDSFAYYVPQSVLKPIENIIQEKEKQHA